MKTDATITPTAALAEEISGKVTHLFCQKPAFCAGKIAVKHRDTSFNVKGYVRVGEPVTLRGKWTNHPKYGRQFDATEIVYTTPADPAGVRAWLEWYASDVGPVKAQQMVDEYGVGLLEMCGTDPGQVAAFARIPIESVHRIAKEWSTFAAKCGIVSELARLGLTQHQAEQVYGRFKGSALTILRDDPFLLLREIDGFGWKTVDALAQKLGVSANHPGRLRAAVATAVVEASNHGSTAIEETVATGRARVLVGLADADFGSAIQDGIHKGQIKTLLISGAQTAYLAIPESVRHESLIWSKLLTSREPNPHVRGDAAAFAAPYRDVVVGGKVCVLDDTQHAAVVAAASSRIVFITGSAGSGKTLVAKAIHGMFRNARQHVRLCAPTGKAARRLTDVIGKEATTIHRLLQYQPDGGFFHDEHNQLSSGVVIVDEVSMVDSSLMFHLMRACGTNVSLVFIGDPNQLPPVGPGSVLRDVIDNDLAPVARLGVCHRQAGPLKTNCAAILEGRVEPSVTDVEPSPWIVHRNLTTPEQVVKAVVVLFEKYLPQWGYDPVTETQFMTVRHAGPLGTVFLNKVCQRLRQKALGVELDEPDPESEEKAVLMVGDRVLHTKNNYMIDVMNGNQGVVVETKPNLVIDYDGRKVQYTGESKTELQLGYVMTPWKAQGSEYPCAVFVCHKSHTHQLHRHLLYTAVTRARRTCVLIGDDMGVHRAADRIDNTRRVTCLAVWSVNPEARSS